MRGIICQRIYALIYEVPSLKIETNLGLSRSPTYSWYIWVQASSFDGDKIVSNWLSSLRYRVTGYLALDIELLVI
jgi:hypothetical protein